MIPFCFMCHQNIRFPWANTNSNHLASYILLIFVIAVLACWKINGDSSSKMTKIFWKRKTSLLQDSDFFCSKHFRPDKGILQRMAENERGCFMASRFWPPIALSLLVSCFLLLSFWIPSMDNRTKNYKEKHKSRRNYEKKPRRCLHVASSFFSASLIPSINV